jgi:hypothetical protein
MFPRSKAEQGRGVNFPLHLSPRLKSKAIPLLSLWASMPCSIVKYLIGPNIIVIHTVLGFECGVIYALFPELNVILLLGYQLSWHKYNADITRYVGAEVCSRRAERGPELF